MTADSATQPFAQLSAEKNDQVEAKIPKRNLVKGLHKIPNTFISWKDDFCERLRQDTRLRDECFVTSYFISPLALFIIRIAMLVYSILVLIGSLIMCIDNDDGGVWLGYFTVLCYFGIVIYFGLATYNTGRYLWMQHVKKKGAAKGNGQNSANSEKLVCEDDEDSTSALHRITIGLQWIFYETAFSLAPFMTTVFWVFLKSYVGSWKPFNSWVNISMHALNVVFMLSEFALGRIGMSPWHIILMAAILLLYLGLLYTVYGIHSYFMYFLFDFHFTQAYVVLFCLLLLDTACIYYVLALMLHYWRDRYLAGKTVSLPSFASHNSLDQQDLQQHQPQQLQSDVQNDINGNHHSSVTFGRADGASLRSSIRNRNRSNSNTSSCSSNSSNIGRSSQNQLSTQQLTSSQAHPALTHGH
ncbi:hypothetical protein H4219_003191 [Mycoemilia scoparia]|uniref:Uncharacterized protein n=1 Tax=Mycoemilia scoparia TaxID=417184 RepID=A0A9W7ZVG2_9FUNG|nr:hypothetical protein H4219_003191 [Mycoemilia scoparia]